MKSGLSIIKIVGIIFGLILVLGAIGSFVEESRVNVMIEEKEAQILKPCELYGCNKTGERRCSSEGLYFGNVETCEFDPIQNCVRWNLTEYCSHGCKNATCREKLPLEPCLVDGCNKIGDRKCESNWVYFCELNTISYCLEWKFNKSCTYGCENGYCKERTEVEVNQKITNYVVTRVIDGDTIELNNGDRVRLILIDAPESGERCYQEAKTRLQQLVLNKEVKLEKDFSETDKYGRLLRYVYVDTIFVNYQMVREGLAYAYPYPPDVKYQTQIEQAEELAREEAKGCLWLPEEKTCTYSISINPTLDSYQNTSHIWSIKATDSSTGDGCPSEITYTITKSTSGECSSTSAPSLITIPKGGSKNFYVSVSRSGNSCSLTISIKDINGIERIRGNYWVELTSSLTPENCIYVSNFHYDAEGDDRYNLNDEYVVFNNKCNVSFDLTSWTINDEANHVYTFPTFTLNPLTSFTLYTGSGTNTNDKLYWKSGSPIWNNDHDTLFLYNTSNNLILSYSY